MSISWDSCHQHYIPKQFVKKNPTAIIAIRCIPTLFSFAAESFDGCRRRTTKMYLTSTDNINVLYPFFFLILPISFAQYLILFFYRTHIRFSEGVFFSSFYRFIPLHFRYFQFSENRLILFRLMWSHIYWTFFFHSQVEC